MNTNVSQIITEKIIEMIEKDNLLPWQQPWFVSPLGNLTKANLLNHDKKYSILNHILLCNCKDTLYLTFNQAQEIGASIKKGAKSQIITFWKILETKEKNDNNEVVEKKVPLLRYYRVFGISDIENIPEKYQKILDAEKKKNEEKKVHDENQDAENYIKNTHAVIKNNNPERAYYSPIEDIINVPDLQNFISQEEYYSVIIHELLHWTGHKERLNRERHKFFADEIYGKEELIAEIGASILKRRFGYYSLENNASYIKGWLSILKNDSTLLISASSRAQDAIEYLDTLQIYQNRQVA